ncbi:hypothetical protein KP509_13G041000 [Ceratopteris richardii]|nr:hypothetical protein KP509_13G041000 [Ceratopteris richardii]
MIQPWLKQNDLQENTQILLFMSSFPENPSEPKGRMHIQNGGRNSCAWGRWGDAMSQIMQNGGLGCSVLRSHEEFLEVMIEKLLWSSIFWLLSDALGGLCVGELAQSYKWAVQELTGELLPLALGKIGNINSSAERSNDRIGEMCERISEDEMLKRLCAYSFAIHDAVPSRSVALSEFQWRNGWFLEQDITSCHLRWLRAAGVDSMIPRH